MKGEEVSLAALMKPAVFCKAAGGDRFHGRRFTLSLDESIDSPAGFPPLSFTSGGLIHAQFADDIRQRLVKYRAEFLFFT